MGRNYQIRLKCVVLLFVGVYILISVVNVLKVPNYRLDKCADGRNAEDFVQMVSVKNGWQHRLNCIPRSPKLYSPSREVILLQDVLSEPFLRIPANKTFTEEVVILSPVRDSENFLHRFVSALTSISYPHNLVSVYFGEEGSTDNTFMVAKRESERLMNEFGFRNSAVVSLNISNKNPTSRSNRQDKKFQISRRCHLAKARNCLTKRGLGKEDWILWIDIDVISFRPDIIQQLIVSDKDVMAASCLRERKSFLSNMIHVRNYDANTFRETVIDGVQYRIWLKDLKSEGREVTIEYVGACLLMIRADAVLKGLYFPEEPYHPVYKLKCGNCKTETNSKLNIESEGLAQVAREMGLSVFGLPHLEVYHV